LTPANVPGLQLRASVPLDDEVDTQPLVYNGIVYVATENNTVYAIDAVSGNVLFTNNFGAPVSTPLGYCTSGNVGIGSTPAIDPGSSTLYVMVYTYDGNGNPTYQLHALDLGSLNDKVAPATVSASGRLDNGQTYNFDASAARQRPALLLSANGNLYAAFGAWCDQPADAARGWVLGWQSGSLAPLPAAHLTNGRAESPDDFFVTSIWMSGYGVAEDAATNLYFSTGNSDTKSYNTSFNLSESVIKLSPDLSTVESFFTPYGGAPEGLEYLEENDLDMSAGGVLVLPDGYVVAAGKVGAMYLLGQGNLGGYAEGNYLAKVPIGKCWCGESYFQGWDGIGRVVSSGEENIRVWQEPSLAQESVSPPLGGTGFGFFTTISSNGTQNAVIWAVARPNDSDPAEVTLYAYDPLAAVMSGPSWLLSAPAGTWPNIPNATSNIVPVVANGFVYVASYQQLAIFGLGSAGASRARPTAQISHPIFKNPIQLAPSEHDIFGTISAINGDSIIVVTRSGASLNVDTTGAATTILIVGKPVRMIGSYNGTVFHAKSIARTTGSSKLWPADR
jgi:hypothetical protein